MPRLTPAVPTDLQQLSGRFEDWRRTRRGKLRIPELLWVAAAELSRSHGVCQTAQVLRLEYKKLKQLTDWKEAVSRSGVDLVQRRQYFEGQAFAWLDKAYRGRDHHLSWLKVNPRLKPLHLDSRYRDWVRRMKFPERGVNG